MKSAHLSIIFFFLVSCKPSHSEIEKLLNSERKCDWVEGYNLIEIYKDTSFKERLLTYQEGDFVLCLELDHKGINPLWAKVKALERITGVAYPDISNAEMLDSSALGYFRAHWK